MRKNLLEQGNRNRNLTMSPVSPAADNQLRNSTKVVRKQPTNNKSNTKVSQSLDKKVIGVINNKKIRAVSFKQEGLVQDLKSRQRSRNMSYNTNISFSEKQAKMI